MKSAANSKGWLRRLRSLLWIVVSGGIAFALLSNARLVSDTFLSLTYNPSPEVQAVSESLNLTTEGKRTLYASGPQLVGPAQLSQECLSHGGDVLTLGCYANGTIFVYQPSQSSIDGLVESTMAHELLHAVYYRLDENEKTEVDRQLSEFLRSTNDESITRQLSAYGGRDNATIANELHSIAPLASVDLPPALQDHYSKYFNDLGGLHDTFNSYWGKFERLNTDIAGIDSDLDVALSDVTGLKSEIDDLRVEMKQLKSELDSVSAQIDGGDSDKISQYNALAQRYNQALSLHNDLVARYNGAVNSYNAMIETRKQKSSDLQDLYLEIDSREALPQEFTQ